MAQIMEGQALDAGPFQSFIVAGPHAVVGVPTGPCGDKRGYFREGG